MAGRQAQTSIDAGSTALMSEVRTLNPPRLAVRTGIALLQGLVLWWLYDAVAHERWPEGQRGWLAGLITVVVLVPAVHYLLVDLASVARQRRVLLAVALLALGLGWHHGAWTADSPYNEPLSFVLPLGVLMFVLLPFVQSALTLGALRPRYEDLFHFAWRNALLAALGGVFTAVFWLLLVLWGGLFRMIGIDFFHEIFESARFAIPATAVAAGVGLQLAGSVERLQTALRQQLLAMLKWLVPLAILILVLFTGALLAKSPELFAEHRRAISAAWLLGLVTLTVALLNAAYQDGKEPGPYPRWLGAAIRFASLLLLPVALLAVYALGVRIAAYGITVSRAWAFLVAAVALAYASGYAWAALRKGAWMAGIGVVNVAVAVFAIVMLLLMLTPPLSPERLAAASQNRRVLADPDSDAYADLRFRTGRYGRARLASLAAIEGPARAADIRGRADRALQLKQPWQGLAPAPESLVAIPAGTHIDPELIAAFGAADDQSIVQSCTRDSPCPVLFANLNREGSDEAILFAQYGVVGATRVAGGWRVLDRLVHLGASVSRNDRETIRRALEAGTYRLGDLPWKAIEINGEYYVLSDATKPAGDCGAAGDAVSRAAEAAPECP
jgi:hypothetical protein